LQVPVVYLSAQLIQSLITNRDTDPIHKGFEREIKMKNFNKAVVGAGMVVLLACGCAAKKVDTTDVPKAPEDTQVAMVATPTPQAVAPAEQKYVVQKGDTLWAIAYQHGIYGNSFEWPLIFKADRDQIQDPDEIVPGQVLLIQQGQTTTQVNNAIQEASDTPKFVPHAEPRKTFGVNYF
jgi:nucleoid-associated protein YgaU